ncbi:MULTISPECIES: response regulator transcription factor [unclassified Helicobacter]|uniref:response regulator transcription factor n=1 Tax=unclassified Helicobacter TaxID=2593540 RepID=UPI000CF0A7EE|nr:MULTISPECIES: response regulator transcription factor [unclassified Helicobacter]
MIYILEDDDSIRELVIYTLQTQNFEIQGFKTAQDFFKALKTSLPKLILLDIMLPDQDGLSVLQTLKNKVTTREIPTILLTAKNSEFDKVKGLDMGADDYISKPFGVMELIARIKAVSRRIQSSVKEEFRIKNFYFNDKKHLVSIDGVNIDLTLKEYKILHLFLNYPNIVFSREQIAMEVWGDDFPSISRTIDMHIKTLRQKLGIYGKLISTVRGVGYKLEQQNIDHD